MKNRNSKESREQSRVMNIDQMFPLIPIDSINQHKASFPKKCNMIRLTKLSLLRSMVTT